MTAAHRLTASRRPDRDPVSIDSDVAHTSRIYDYLLGGTDHFAVDREVAEHAFAAYPGGIDGARADARANRAFLARVGAVPGRRRRASASSSTSAPASPTGDNTHAVAQALGARRRASSTSTTTRSCWPTPTPCSPGSPEGTAAYIQGDLRRPDAVLDQAAATLDLGPPVALLLVGRPERASSRA